MLCSSVAGFCTRTTTAPFDVLKIQRQIGIPEARYGMRHAAVVMLREQGPRAFFKGNYTAALKMGPYSAVQFAIFQNLKPIFSDINGRLTPGKAALSGGFAGLCAAAATHPMDVLKTRRIVQPVDMKLSAYGMNTVDSLKKIYTEEGFLALYRGLSITLLGSIPFTAATFGTYEFLKGMYQRPNILLSTEETILQGTIASAVALLTTFPFDVVRRKMEAKSHVLPNRGGVDIEFRNAIHCFKKIIIINGLSGLYRGLVPALLRVIPYNSIMFLGYEACKRGFIFFNGYTDAPLQNEPRWAVDQSFEQEEMDDVDYYSMDTVFEVFDELPEDESETDE
ncbi:hypothetical protein ScPMuIL_011387 [Solemya velum]